jgi:WD40 repeat protein
MWNGWTRRRLRAGRLINGFKYGISLIVYPHLSLLSKPISREKKEQLAEKKIRGHTHEVNQIRLNRHRTLLASCSDDTTVRIWEVSDWRSEGTKTNGRFQASAPPSEFALTILSGHTEAIGSISWRPTTAGVDKILAT